MTYIITEKDKKETEEIVDMTIQIGEEAGESVIREEQQKAVDKLEEFKRQDHEQTIPYPRE